MVEVVSAGGGVVGGICEGLISFREMKEAHTHTKQSRLTPPPHPSILYVTNRVPTCKLTCIHTDKEYTQKKTYMKKERKPLQTPKYHHQR